MAVLKCLVLLFNLSGLPNFAGADGLFMADLLLPFPPMPDEIVFGSD